MPIQDAGYPEEHVWVYDPEEHEWRLVPIEDADKPLGGGKTPAGHTANTTEVPLDPNVD